MDNLHVNSMAYNHAKENDHDGSRGAVTVVAEESARHVLLLTHLPQLRSSLYHLVLQ